MIFISKMNLKKKIYMYFNGKIQSVFMNKLRSYGDSKYKNIIKYNYV